MSDWATLKDLKERSANAYLLGTGPKKLWTKKHVAKKTTDIFCDFSSGATKNPWSFQNGAAFETNFRNRQLSPPQSLPPNWHLSRWHRGESRLHFSAPHGLLRSVWCHCTKKQPKSLDPRRLFYISSCVFFVHPSIPSVPGAWFCCWLSIRRNSGSYR